MGSDTGFPGAAGRRRLSAAAALLLLAWLIVGVWRIGPVVWVLTATHGVHAGDALAVVPVLGAAWLLGYRVVAPAGRSRTASTATSAMLITATASPHQG